MRTNDNQRRAEAAEIAMCAYVEDSGNEWGEDNREELMSDLVADLGHLADVYEVDIGTIVDIGIEHYRKEKDCGHGT